MITLHAATFDRQRHDPARRAVHGNATIIVAGKILPVLLALEQADEVERKSWLALFNDGEAHAETIRERLLVRGIPAQCREVVAGHITAANDALADLPGGREPLKALAG